MDDALAQRIYALKRPSPMLLWYYLVGSLVALCLFPFVFVPLYFKYKTLEYQFDDRGVRASWGILFRREVFLTYGRIQDIHLNRGLIERWMNLGTVNIQTASGSAGAELSIVGLHEYEAIRDFLYSRMRGRQQGKRGGAAPGAGTQTASSALPAPTGGEALPAPRDVQGSQEVAQTLTAIRDELRALREAVEKRGS